jgi:outer membrane protein assembly factor BamB
MAPWQHPSDGRNASPLDCRPWFLIASDCRHLVSRSARWFMVVVLTATLAEAADSWPCFRGRGARGVAADDPRLPTEWSDRTNVRWVADLEGRGWSSPIVANGRVFVTTAVAATPLEDARKGLFFGGDRTDLPAGHVRWLVTCLEADSGLTRWEVQVAAGPPPGPIHVKNSLASETPVTDGRRIYAAIGNVGIFCLDADTGDRVWEYRLLPRAMRAGWGPAASPVLHQGRLYLVNDNEEASALVALDARTGRELWRVARAEQSNWSTPFVWEHPLGTELVTPGTDKTRSYNLDGRLLWELGGASEITIATPYAAHGLLFVSSGFVLDRKRPIWAIRPGARGDITLGTDASASAAIAWSRTDSAPYNPSTLVYGDELYVLSDRGLMACYDARTGTQHYRKARLPGGRAFTASPWAYNGMVFCASEYGETFAIRAGPTFELVAHNLLAEDDMLMASPAIAGGRLFLRTDQRLYCLERPPQQRGTE